MGIRHALHGLRRRCKRIHTRLGQQTRAVAVSAAGEQARFADEQRAALAVAQVARVFHVRVAGRFKSVVPGHRYRWLLPARRELIADNGCNGVGFVIEVGTVRLHRFRRAQV
ncbi:MAG: hypothetical protein BWX80_00999 [Candidatus Hydrogenedentes bacterium ADurb.Bin101]|nr:MAG: hypothetical protein BWX80_00999 [Candidatus Hydrogenedentes bacterium ADurb.Bin101]